MLIEERRYAATTLLPPLRLMPLRCHAATICLRFDAADTPYYAASLCFPAHHGFGAAMLVTLLDDVYAAIERAPDTPPMRFAACAILCWPQRRALLL